jgi:xanthine/uracil/vitamin C permease (AzgA family)
MERRFRFAERGTTLARDTMAGVTTFIVMSYIIFVNPQILSFAGIEGLEGRGLPFDAVLAVTCLVAGVMTMAMGLYTNYAYAIAPGLGINATVAFGLVAGEGLSFPAAMGLVVVEGVAVTIFVLTGLREKVMDAIPLDLKKAIAIGIGLFIAFIGFESAGIVVPGTPVVDLAPLSTWPIFVAMFGLVLTIALRARGVRGDLLIGIIAATALATIINEASDGDAGFTVGATIPDDVYETPNLELLGDFNFDAFTELAFISAVVWAFSLFMADFFDTMGTLVGVGKQAGYVDDEGRLADIRKPLLVDSLSAVAGGGRLVVFRDDVHRVGVGHQRRRANRLGRGRVRRALPAVHVLRADHRHGAAAGHGAGFDHRRLPDDERAHRGRGRRGGRDGAQARRNRLQRPRDRPRSGADDHGHAVHVLHRRRNRVRLHRLRHRPCGRGPMEGRPPVHVGGERRVRALLHRPLPPGHVRLDLALLRSPGWGSRSSRRPSRLASSARARSRRSSWSGCTSNASSGSIRS